MVELTKILHSKLLLQRGDDALKQLLTGGSEHNVINIEQQVGSLIPTAVDDREVSALASVNPKVSKNVENREYQACGACFRSQKDLLSRQTISGRLKSTNPAG